MSEELVNIRCVVNDTGVLFRNEIVSRADRQQILIYDPSGKPIELFQPAGQ